MNELSIIVPCPVPVSNFTVFIDDISQYLITNPSDVDVVIVFNEDSIDANLLIEFTKKKYPWLKLKLLQRSGKQRRYGALVRFGLAYSTSKYAVLVSPYGGDDLSIITRMLSEVRRGAQVVQATRYANVQDLKNIGLRFRIYQSIYRLLTTIFIGVKISDSTYGFKMFDRIFIQALGLVQNGFAISAEITLKATLSGGIIRYIDSTVSNKNIHTGFKLSKDGLGYLWALVRGSFHRVGLLWF